MMKSLIAFRLLLVLVCVAVVAVESSNSTKRAITCTGGAPQCISVNPVRDEPTPPNFLVAFIGDQGINSDAKKVLQMVKAEGAQAVFHSGDFDYDDNPSGWESQINSILGQNFPYFSSIGNHDVPAWTSPNGGYQRIIYNRLINTPGIRCNGEVGVNTYCTYKGLSFVLSGVGTKGSNHVQFVQESFAKASGRWRICSFHKNMKLMQVGGKSDETGWQIYDTCGAHGAIVATAHEHSYARTFLMSKFSTQTVVSRDPAAQLVLDAAKGHSFAFVSGVAGESLRSFSGTLYRNAWWASAHSADNGLKDGALFCRFNLNSQVDQGECYFKQTDNRVLDTFRIKTTVPDTLGGGNEIPSDTASSTTGRVAATTASSRPATTGRVGTTTGQVRPSTTGAPLNTGTSTTGTPDASCPPTRVTRRIPIRNRNDDVEQAVGRAALSCTSSDLEMTKDGSVKQTIGVRFQGIDVAPTDEIVSAVIEFTADETSKETTNLVIVGENSPKSDSLCDSRNLPENRPKTSTQVSWFNVPSWTSGKAHSSPDVSDIIKEIIAQPGWVAGNPISFFISGSGFRSAKSYDSGKPARLVLTLVSTLCSAGLPQPTDELEPVEETAAAGIDDDGIACSFDCAEWSDNSHCEGGQCVCDDGYDVYDNNTCQSASEVSSSSLVSTSALFVAVTAFAVIGKLW